MTAWTKACQAPLPMGFSRQEYWSGLPFPSPGDLPDPGIKPEFPALAGGFSTTAPPYFFILGVSYIPLYICTTFLTENFKAYTLLLSTCRSSPSPSDENYPNFKIKRLGNSPVVQWLGLNALTTRGPSSTPGWGTKILKATQRGQINKQKETVVVV